MGNDVIFIMYYVCYNLQFIIQGSGFRVRPRGVLPFDYVRKRFSGFYSFKRFKGGGAAHKK